MKGFEVSCHGSKHINVEGIEAKMVEGYLNYVIFDELVYTIFQITKEPQYSMSYTFRAALCCAVHNLLSPAGGPLAVMPPLPLQSGHRKYTASC